MYVCRQTDSQSVSQSVPSINQTRARRRASGKSERSRNARLLLCEIGEQYRSYIEFEIVLGVPAECFWECGELVGLGTPVNRFKSQ